MDRRGRRVASYELTEPFKALLEHGHGGRIGMDGPERPDGQPDGGSGPDDAGQPDLGITTTPRPLLEVRA
ncbi:hypothetical protein Ae168Ps1_3990c [Pseudonocardia sp. Ae168_Ps1]|nr:hypothetical protein Ae150APs1_3967c [Pseudonocardia sp. Ae150A_Ps1]OLL81584.1 hypothetical protein Ae168Ps1_3990c [Pseudonocardia sp. Ae168_Ps1]OLL84303.1 hypothetical protein Ae263Ps1_1358 [Pseudonocardia sp. Ae263_Ps1]OLL95679.1 hypothetical protein Ae356Ps1_5576c [Pseudonocardia sp. Ae356_Ps1]